MTMRQFRESARKFKTFEQLTKEELVSVLKECEHRLFRISVTLNSASSDFYTKEEVEETRESSYEMWYYLGAIGTIRKLKGKELADMSNDAWCCLKSPLTTQRRFLSHTKRKAKKK